MEMDISLRILEDRERRYYEILELIKEYQMPVLCGKVNYPGRDKNTLEAGRAFKVLKEAVGEEFKTKTVLTKELGGYDGRCVLMVINMPSEEIKRASVRIEDGSRIGRIFDIDVYVASGSSIGREMINMTPRECVICGENARLCVRSGKHTLKDTLDKINQIINNYGD